MSGSDEEVYVIDSSPSDHEAVESPSEDCATDGWSSGGHPERSIPAAAKPADRIAKSAPSQVAVVNVGTSTEPVAGASADARLRLNLVRLARAVGDTVVSGDEPAEEGERTERAGARRSRAQPAWADTLADVKRLCRRRLDRGDVLPPPETERDRRDGGEQLSLADGAEQKPLWLPQLEAAARAMGTTAAAATPDLSPTIAGEARAAAVATRYLFVPDEARANEEEHSAAPPVPVTRPSSRDETMHSPRMTTAAALATDALSSDERRTLSEAAVILAKERATSLLDVYADMLRLRRQQRDSLANAMHDTAAAAAGRETLFRMMLEHLTRGAQSASAAFRSRCADVAGTLPSVADLQSELEAIRRLRLDLVAVRREAAKDASAVDVPPVAQDSLAKMGTGAKDHREHGGAFDVFQAAQAADLAALRERVRQLSGKLQDATASVKEWRDKYVTLAARLDSQEEEESKVRIRPEVFKAYRDKCRDCLANLAAILGSDMTQLAGFRVSLRPEGSWAEVVVDLSTGEVVSGSLPACARTVRRATPSTHGESAPAEPPLGLADASPQGLPSLPPSPERVDTPGNCDGVPAAADLPPVPASPSPASESTNDLPMEGPTDGDGAEGLPRPRSASQEQSEHTGVTEPFSNDVTVTNTTLTTSRNDEGGTLVNASGGGHESSEEQDPTASPRQPKEDIGATSPTLPTAGDKGTLPSPRSRLFAENALWGEDD